MRVECRLQEDQGWLLEFLDGRKVVRAYGVLDDPDHDVGDDLVVSVVKTATEVICEVEEREVS